MGGLIGSIVTVIFFVTFGGIVYWAWSDRRKEEFEEAANYPFVDDDKPEQPKAPQ